MRRFFERARHSGIRAAVIGLVLIGAGAALVSSAHPLLRYQESKCVAASVSKAEQTECFKRVLANTIERNGVAAAIEEFDFIHTRYAGLFPGGDCHALAHYVGDMAYYRVYLGSADLDSLDFPPESTICTFGFYHGFFEHLFQNDPRESFITDTCDYFEKRLSGSISSIRHVCYHGAGHGLMLARADKVPRSEWGDPTRFVLGPLRQCDALPKADDMDRMECRQGAFTVLVDWMALKQYGLSFDDNAPLSVCDAIPEVWRAACFDQVADRYFGGSVPRTFAEYAAIMTAAIPGDHDARMWAFSQAVAGRVLAAMADGSVEELVAQCDIVPKEYFDTCIRTFPRALFNAGDAQQEYKAALPFCASGPIAERGASGTCYAQIAVQMGRFYGPEKIREVCALFPKAERSSCESTPASR